MKTCFLQSDLRCALEQNAYLKLTSETVFPLFPPVSSFHYREWRVFSHLCWDNVLACIWVSHLYMLRVLLVL